jgi:hypothetical protein
MKFFSLEEIDIMIGETQETQEGNNLQVSAGALGEASEEYPVFGHGKGDYPLLLFFREITAGYITFEYIFHVTGQKASRMPGSESVVGGLYLPDRQMNRNADIIELNLRYAVLCLLWFE